MSANIPKVDLSGVIAQFNNLDVKVRLTIFGACVAAIVALDYFLLIRLQLKWLADIQTATQTVIADTGRVKADLQRVGQIKENVESTRKEMDMIKAKVRPMEQVPVILEEISKVANEFHVDIQQLEPLKNEKEPLLPEEKAKPAAKGAKAPAKTAVSEYYTLPIVITARSGYHMFGQFLNKLESSNLLFMVRDLHIQGDGGEGLTISTSLKMVVTDPVAEVKK
jgi:Tfp pilus assembly protein PilO